MNSLKNKVALPDGKTGRSGGCQLTKGSAGMEYLVSRLNRKSIASNVRGGAHRSFWPC
jgi:hypothetical protein